MSPAESYEILFIDPSQEIALLPTPNDIDGSAMLIKESSGSRIVKIEQFIIKYGVFVKPIEAYSMLHVANSTTVPVPKLYALYQRHEVLEDEPEPVTYIVMQYVQGTTLLDLWGSLDEDRKTSIAKTLRTHMDHLRKLQHPGYFGNVNGGPPIGDLFSESQAADTIKSSRDLTLVALTSTVDCC